MTATSPNPLISSQKSSELQAVLHPLVLLTISDYITRHTLRNQKGPIIGALLGQQNGREITIEHAFEAHTREAPEVEGGYLLEDEKFGARLQQMVLVHKDRELDLVGWYTLLPTSGPSPNVLSVHDQILRGWNESAILLGFHPEEVLHHSVGGKLPLTIYESNYEVDEHKTEQDGEDKKMDDGEPTLKLKFREVSYSVETDETEMISMNYVAASGGNAAAVQKDERSTKSVESGKGKRRAVENKSDILGQETPQEELDSALTPEEDEMIAALTARANAIKMLQSRIRLVSAYLERLPPSYINGRTTSDDTMDTDHTTPSLNILRQIQALVSRFDLVIPSDETAYQNEMLHEANDVNLINLLNNVMQSLGEARDVGKKFQIVEQAKTSNRRAHQDFGGDMSSFPAASEMLL